jgi:MFS family permease
MTLTINNIWRNKLAYYLIKVDLIGLILIAIFDKWTKNGMSFSQILLLQGVFGLFILLAEFPSGVLADIRSRKELLLIGEFFIILGIIAYLYFNDFLGFLTAEFFFAVGLASKSGTDSAFAYDSFLEIGLPNESDNLIGRGQQLTLFGNVFMLSLGGIMTVVDIRLPFIIASFGYFIGILSLIFAIEPSRLKTKSSNEVMIKSIKYLRHSLVLKVLLMLIFPGVSLRIVFWSYIPKLSSTTLEPQLFGIILGGANLVAFLVSLWAKKHKDSHWIIYLLPVGFIGLIIFLNDGLPIILFGIVLHQISRGIISVVSGIFLNRSVDSEARASIASLLGTIVSLIYFLFSIFVDGLNMSQETILFINIFIGLLFFVLWYLLIVIPNEKVDKKIIEINTVNN